MAKKRTANVDSDHPDYHFRNVVLPEELTERVMSWHGGQYTMTYSLGSTAMSDYVSPSMIDAAVDELESELPKVRDPEDRKDLENLIGELDSVARFSDEFTYSEGDSGYATWLMEKSTKTKRNKNPLKWERKRGGEEYVAEIDGRVLTLIKQPPRRDFPEGFWALEVLDHEHGYTHSYSWPIVTTTDIEEAKRSAEQALSSMLGKSTKTKRSKSLTQLKNKLMR